MGFEPMRENEAIAFFRDNKIATPARVTSFNSVGGKKQPVVEANHMTGDPGMGKQVAERDPDLSAFNDNALNVT